MLVVLGRYLQYGKYQDKEAVLAKTHIFTTYFYKRLTTRPSSKNKANKHHPVEDDPSLSPAEKRYDRVRKWTKKVNLFDKDFIVVPINEHAHWFVCIICFPGEFFFQPVIFCCKALLHIQIRCDQGYFAVSGFHPRSSDLLNGSVVEPEPEP
jgi:Ulp1 family protease